MTFKDAVECYRCLLCKGHLDELDEVSNAYNAWFKHPNSTKLHEFARLCVVGGHQHRIPTGAKNNAISTLEKHLPTLFKTHFKDFEDLYAHVNSMIGGIPHIGLLAVYDVSLRIGHLFSSPIYPKRYLYLNNSGAMNGAKKLLGGRKLAYREELSVFFSYPEALKVTDIASLKSLPNSLVEDFLCVMHNYLDKGPTGLIADRWTTSTYKKIQKHS